MCALGLWHAVCVLCYVGAAVCVNGDEYEVNYADSYDNEITQQQEGEPHAAPCQAPEFPRWDQLFITLEDSHMRQNMLLGALEVLHQRCGGVASLSCQQCAPGPESSSSSSCQRQVEQASLRLQRGLAELRVEGVERERRLNGTLQRLLHGCEEQGVRLKRLEGEVVVLRAARATGGGGPAGAGAGPITQRPGGSVGTEPGSGTGTNYFPSSVPKEQEATATPDMARMERALVTMATELRKVQAQLSILVERGASEGGQRRRRETED